MSKKEGLEKCEENQEVGILRKARDEFQEGGNAYSCLILETQQEEDNEKCLSNWCHKGPR